MIATCFDFDRHLTLLLELALSEPFPVPSTSDPAYTFPTDTKRFCDLSLDVVAGSNHRIDFKHFIFRKFGIPIKLAKQARHCATACQSPGRFLPSAALARHDWLGQSCTDFQFYGRFYLSQARPCQHSELWNSQART